MCCAVLSPFPNRALLSPSNFFGQKIVQEVKGNIFTLYNLLNTLVIKHQWVYIVIFFSLCSWVVIKMKLKEKTNNPPFCNYFYFFQFGPLLFSYFSHLWTFFGQDRCTHPQHKCALPTLYRNHKFRLQLFHPTPHFQS